MKKSRQLIAAVLAVMTAVSVMCTSVFADTEYMPKGIKETQKQYENLISVAIEKSEYDEGQIDKEHIFIVEHTSPMQMRKNEEPIWLYVALPIVDSTDISYAHFDEDEYVSAVTNFAALDGTESPYGNKLHTYVDENKLSEPSEITNLWVGEGVHIFAHKMTCNDKEYIIPYYLTNDSIFKRIKKEDCNIEIGKAYTLDEFLNVCETAAELFEESKKSENKQDKSETFVDDNDDETTTKSEETKKPEKDVEIADKIKNEEEKTDVVDYAVTPTEKWDFAQGEYTESLNDVLSAECRGYSGKYFSAKANKMYSLDICDLETDNESGKITFTIKNKNNGMTVNNLNYEKMVYSYSTDGSGDFETPNFMTVLEFQADTDFYLEITTSNPQSAKGYGSYIISEADKVYFNDTIGHWAEKTINKWADKGIISGYPDGTFKPDNPVTRAELAKILTLAFDLPESEFVYSKDEINQNDWYYPYLICAAKYIPVYALPESNEKNKPYVDNGGNAFLPEETAIRMHVAESFVEIKKERDKSDLELPAIQEIAMELKEMFPHEDYGNLYPVHGQIPGNVSRMHEYTYLAVKLDIMKGDTDGYFRPYDGITRAELITMIDRIKNN